MKTRRCLPRAARKPPFDPTMGGSGNAAQQRRAEKISRGRRYGARCAAQRAAAESGKRWR